MKVAINVAVIIYITVLIPFVTAQTPQLQWAKNLGGASSTFGTCIKVDNPGNIYSTGQFSGTNDFDPDLGTYNLTSAGGSDIYLSKPLKQSRTKPYKMLGTHLVINFTSSNSLPPLK